MFAKTFIFSLIFSLVKSDYILFPKEDKHDIIPFFTFLEPLLEVEGIPFYKTSDKFFNVFENSLNDHFYVERDQIISLDTTDFILLSSNAKQQIPWHLTHITNKALNEIDPNSYRYNQSGSCHANPDVEISTYVIDTGIDVTHSEFEGRATWLGNFADSVDTDCNSHGTFCASNVGGKRYGVCKDAKLYAVKVLNCEGSGTNSGVMKGIELAYKTHLEKQKKNKGARGIISMSLGGGYSRALNKMISLMIENSNTFYFSVAAGNENQDACNVSPASVDGVLTAMASDKYNNRAYFSNWGTCADVYSPGVDIEGATPNEGKAVYSGTSMSTPILAGILNHYLDQYPHLNMKTLKDKVLRDSTENLIRKNKPETNNFFVYLHRHDDNSFHTNNVYIQGEL
jgi:cerevisin